jgi:radical SAM-linked protein
LPLGVIGADEVVELELKEPWSADDVRDRLQAKAPHGLLFHSATVIDERRQAAPRRVVYRLPLPRSRTEDIRQAAQHLLGCERVWVERTRPRPRRVNIRPYLREIRVHGDAVEFDLWVTQTGTARADELARLLGLQDVLDAGTALTRTTLELHDELTGSPGDAPPDGPPETEPLRAVPAGADEDTSPTATWGATPNGPVVE